MKVKYKNNQIRKICTDASTARKEHGVKMAAKIYQRVDEIKAADNVEMLIQYRIGRCHALKGDRENQYAMDLVQPYRLVFTKQGEEIQIAEIQEIVDYH